MESGMRGTYTPRDIYRHHVCYNYAMQPLETELICPATVPPSSPSTTTTEDVAYRDLIRRIASADESALADLYDATARYAYALALRITRNPQDAEEVVEDTYFQIWRRADQYDAQRGRVLAWVLTLCRSRALDLLRRQDQAELHADPGSLGEESDDQTPDPQQLVAMFQRDSAVHAAVTQLTGVQQQLIGLAFLRDMSHQQIADHLNMPLGTVKTHIRKALTALQGLLENVRISGGD